MVGKAAKRYGAEMNSTLPYNARRIAQGKARENEILDYIREHSSANQSEILRVLARRWRVTERTARITLESCKRKGMLKSKKEVITTWYLTS